MPRWSTFTSSDTFYSPMWIWIRDNGYQKKIAEPPIRLFNSFHLWDVQRIIRDLIHSFWPCARSPSQLRIPTSAFNAPGLHCRACSKHVRGSHGDHPWFTKNQQCWATKNGGKWCNASWWYNMVVSQNWGPVKMDCLLYTKNDLRKGWFKGTPIIRNTHITN